MPKLTIGRIGALVASISACAVGVIAVRGCLAKGHLASAEAALARGILGETESHAKAYLTWYPDDSAANAIMTQVARERGRLRDVLSHAARVAPTDPKLGLTKLCAADALIKLDRGGDAEQLLRECLRLDPASVEARQGLIHIYRWEDRVSEARQLIDELFEIVPAERRHQVLAERFVIDYGQFNAQSVRARLETWIKNCPGDVNARAAFSKVLATDGETEPATALARECVAADPANIEARRSLVFRLLAGGRAREAEAAMKDWPETPRDARYSESRGLVAQEGAAQYADAVTHYERVVATNPDDWQTRHRLSNCLRLLGREKEAADHLHRADAIRATLEYSVIARLLAESLPQLPRPDVSVQFASVYESVGRITEARRWYQLALQYSPQNDSARAALIRLGADPSVKSP